MRSSSSVLLGALMLACSSPCPPQRAPAEAAAAVGASAPPADAEAAFATSAPDAGVVVTAEFELVARHDIAACSVGRLPDSLYEWLSVDGTVRLLVPGMGGFGYPRPVELAYHPAPARRVQFMDCDLVQREVVVHGTPAQTNERM